MLLSGAGPLYGALGNRGHDGNMPGKCGHDDNRQGRLAGVLVVRFMVSVVL